MIDTLVRVSIPFLYDYQSVPYEQGVYSFVLTKLEEYDSYYSTWSETPFNEERLVLLGVRVTTSSEVFDYTKKDTLAQCVADEESWYFDRTNQVLYVHYLFGLRPSLVMTTVGRLRGYSLKDLHYIDDVKYEPRLARTPAFKKKVDPANVGKMSFQDVTVTFANGEGELDEFIPDPIPGSLMQAAVYDSASATETTYGTWKVSADTNTIDDLSIKGLDVRRSENIKIPTGRFTTTAYPNINEKWINKIIPDGYGPQKAIPCFPLNEDESGTPDITFKYAVRAYASVTPTIYAKINDEWAEVTSGYLTHDIANGEVTITRAQIIGAGRTRAYDVMAVDVTLGEQAAYSVDEVISDTNERYAGITYDAANYNTTEFEAEGAKAGDDVSIYMGKQQPIFKWYEQLQTGCLRNFVYDIQGDGKRTIRTDDETRTATDTIEYPKIKNDQRKVERDFSFFSSSIEITYNEDRRYDTEQVYEDTTFEGSAIQKYGYPNKRTISANLSDSADVETKAELLAEDQSEARPVYAVTIHADALSKLNRKLYEVVTVDTSIPEEIEQENVDMFFINPDGDPFYFSPGSDDVAFYINPDGEPYYFNPDGNDLIYLTGGDLPDVYYIHPPDDIIKPGREYFGEVTGKVIEISYRDPDYTIKIRETAS